MGKAGVIRDFALCGAFLIAIGSLTIANDCTQASTTAEQVDCAAQAYEEADRILNETYQGVQKSLADFDRQAQDGGDRSAKLRLSQRSWLTYRDARCELAAATAFGGTLAPVLRVSCLEEVTLERVRQLNEVEAAFGS